MLGVPATDPEYGVTTHASLSPSSTLRTRISLLAAPGIGLPSATHRYVTFDGVTDHLPDAHDNDPPTTARPDTVGGALLTGPPPPPPDEPDTCTETQTPC